MKKLFTIVAWVTVILSAVKYFLSQAESEGLLNESPLEVGKEENKKDE